MKKMTVILFALLLMVLSSGAALATTYTHTLDLDRWITGVGSTSWTHPTPADLNVPPAVVNYATLEIEAYFVDGCNDQVLVESIVQGTLHNATWVWTGFLQGHFEGQTFNIADIFGVWTGGDDLNVTLNFVERPFGFNYMKLDSSTLEIDYKVPEPATLLLLGIGLVGLAGMGRRIEM